MRTIIILAIIFVLMLTVSLAGAAVYYRKRQGTVLHINQGRIRDARYFGKSFSALVQSKLGSVQGNKIWLSKEETFLDADQAWKEKETVEKLVIARKKEFCPSAQVQEFQKEIYSEENAALIHSGLKIRAAYCKKRMILGDGISVVRWVDAEETLAVYDHCDLGISASAGEQMAIGSGCRFRRLYASEMRIGQKPDSTLQAEEGKDPRIFRLQVQVKKENNMRYISKEMINEEGIVDFTVISGKNITVTEKIIVQGDIRSHGGVRLCEDAVVCGNIFAEDDVLLEKNAVVLGNIFSQGSIRLEERAVVGQRGKVSSVIARENIFFAGDNFVFGYVSCERGGCTAEPEEKNWQEEKKQFVFLKTPHYLQHLTFKDLNEYEHVDWQGFRKEPELLDAVIPFGAVQIPRSMFFACRGGVGVILPASLKGIEDYAFADCCQLSELTGFADSDLEMIGTSAFENCEKISELKLPSSVQNLGGAAFGGCRSLRAFIISSDSLLKQIGDHCFRGCRQLEEIWIPEGVNYVGVSAFKGCDALKRIHLPESCREQAGILELEDTPIDLIFRKPAGEQMDERTERD